ncbi:peroxiredoxin-4-like isoform X3 [Pocillopora verrucosa]|uniref:peroxiredoxin-4-like isoform X3 n=1 Tax=Pocillopora verrucosa TaxID=203993 RepID=UPI003340E069
MYIEQLEWLIKKSNVWRGWQKFLNQNRDHWEGTAAVNGEFKYLKMTDSRGKYLVFFFYPLDFTFVCPTEIIAFSDRIEEFRAINTEVVGCSVDSV